jgi:hypothetical protein
MERADFERREFRDLDVYAAAYQEILALYYGHNNGNIGMSCRYLASRIHCCNNVPAAAIRKLISAGLVEVGSPSRVGAPMHQARTYRLMHKKCDLTGMRPWKPSNPKKAA